MKTLRITINGKVYDATVEEIANGSAPAPVAAAPAPVAAPVAAPAPAAAPAAAPVAAGEGTPVKAPMPGNVLNVFVKAGDAVEKNQVLLILEAMKMENEIKADRDGTVTSVAVKKGDTVNADDLFLTIA